MIEMTAKSVQNTQGQTLFHVEMKNTETKEMVVKNISTEDYVLLLQKSGIKREEKVRVRGSLLPKGYIDGAFTQNGFDVVWREEGKQRLFVTTYGRYMIPYPDLIFAISVRNGRVMQDYVFAAVGDTLYNYPFGNVSSSGSICMGNIDTSCAATDIGSFAEEFFLGETNHDYVDSEKIKPAWSQKQLLEKLQGKKAFPKKWLVEADVQLNELVNRIVN